MQHIWIIASTSPIASCAAAWLKPLAGASISSLKVGRPFSPAGTERVSGWNRSTACMIRRLSERALPFVLVRYGACRVLYKAWRNRCSSKVMELWPTKIAGDHSSSLALIARTIS